MRGWGALRDDFRVAPQQLCGRGGHCLRGGGMWRSRLGALGRACVWAGGDWGASWESSWGSRRGRAWECGSGRHHSVVFKAWEGVGDIWPEPWVTLTPQHAEGEQRSPGPRDSRGEVGKPSAGSLDAERADMTTRTEGHDDRWGSGQWGDRRGKGAFRAGRAEPQWV